MSIEIEETATVQENAANSAAGTKAVTISITPKLYNIWRSIKKGRRSEFVKMCLLYVGTFNENGVIDPDIAIDEMRRLFDARKAIGK